MQTEDKEIYKYLAAKNEKPEQVYKDVGTFVFRTLQSRLRRPKSLITKLRGVGTWFLRRKRMQMLVDLFPPNFELTEEDFKSPLSVLENENKKEMFLLFKKRLEEYEEYINLRNEIRKLRNDKTLLESPEGEDEGNQSSQNNS